MARKKRSPADPEARRVKNLPSGQRTRSSDGASIVTQNIGAAPLLVRILERMRLEKLLGQYLPDTDQRVKPGTDSVLCLLVLNLLISREPVYGVAEWACQYPPDLFNLWVQDLEHLNDDRVGRALDRLFDALDSGVILAVVQQVIQEFRLELDEIHNDSTSVSFFGAYEGADTEGTMRGKPTPAITWGFSKDHRPDLKQLLYILTVTDDGGVPIYFQTSSGNTTDDNTHESTWNVMRQLIDRPDFVYVADCKMASTNNMNAIARQGGRFITVLPATRKECDTFRGQMRAKPDKIKWTQLYQVQDDKGEILDTYSACSDDHVSAEGFRIVWIFSTGKKDRDALARISRTERAIHALTKLRERLQGPRTRFRDRSKVDEEVQGILQEFDVADWLTVNVEELEKEQYKQSDRGRPTKDTKYVRHVETRYTLTWSLDQQQLELAGRADGTFPLISNIRDWSERRILEAYKRQPIIEKRFSQFKTDFQVAPVYLKNIGRVVALLAVYFFALMVQTLFERELRRAMNREGIASIPLYPEGRQCAAPTTRQVIDLFESVQRHTLRRSNQEDLCLTTDLPPLHRQIVKLMNGSIQQYGL